MVASPTTNLTTAQHGRRSTCSVGPCQDPATCRGMCPKHYTEARRNGLGKLEKPAHCAMCEAPVSARGLCKRHYRYAKHHGTLAGVPKCSLDCPKSVYQGEFCYEHWYADQTYGDPLAKFRAKRGTRRAEKNGRYQYVKVGGEFKLAHRVLMEGHLGRPLADDERVYKIRGRAGNSPEDFRVARFGVGWLNTQGYRVISVDGKNVLEHRHIMAGILGRPLRPEEEVHHVNGVRADNRHENLELWSWSQPKGQRVEDKVAWAKEILALYDDLAGGSRATCDCLSTSLTRAAARCCRSTSARLASVISTADGGQ